MKAQNKERLLPRQSVFVKEYLVDRNGTRAYLAAGYEAKAPEAAASAASRLLRQANIQAALRGPLLEDAALLATTVVGALVKAVGCERFEAICAQVRQDVEKC